MALNSNALTSLATAKEYLEIPSGDATQDSNVERLINEASQYIETYCNRKFINQTHTEYQDGRASNRIMLSQYPITGGPAAGSTRPEVSIDNSSIFAASSVVDVTSYFEENVSGELIKIGGSILGGRWPKGIRNIKIVYEAGLGIIGTLPSDLVRACLDHVLWSYESLNDRRIGKTNRSKGDESTSWELDVPVRITSILDRNYVKHDFSTSVGVLNS